MALSDDEKIERLSDYIIDAVAECFEDEETTSSDVLAAFLLSLERTLRGLRKVQEPEERFENAKLIKTALNDLLVEFGRVPS